MSSAKACTRLDFADELRDLADTAIQLATGGNINTDKRFQLTKCQSRAGQIVMELTKAGHIDFDEKRWRDGASRKAYRMACKRCRESVEKPKRLADHPIAVHLENEEYWAAAAFDALLCGFLIVNWKDKIRTHPLQGLTAEMSIFALPKNVQQRKAFMKRIANEPIDPVRPPLFLTGTRSAASNEGEFIESDMHRAHTLADACRVLASVVRDATGEGASVKSNACKWSTILPLKTIARHLDLSPDSARKRTVEPRLKKVGSELHGKPQSYYVRLDTMDETYRRRFEQD